MLCSCNASPAPSVNSAADLEAASENTSSQTAGMTEGAADQATALPITGETEQSENEQSEYNFIPVLTEDDIEYMGIPYKDLTLEQFIQLWAQCENENNVQRLYVISYNNNSYTDELTGEPVEPTELETEQLLKDFAELNLRMELAGRMVSRISNAELSRDEYAPDGYYDDDESKEHHYCITYTQTRLGSDNSDVEEAIRWISLKKINGYWKIGVMKNTSPPSIFLPEL